MSRTLKCWPSLALGLKAHSMPGLTSATKIGLSCWNQR